MIKKREADLICDFAETYHILNYRELPLKTAALLLSGLKPDSRVMMAETNQKLPFDTMLLASIADSLKLLVWARTEDAAKGRNRPKLILDSLFSKQKKEELITFRSGEEFMKELQKLQKSPGKEVKE